MHLPYRQAFFLIKKKLLAKGLHENKNREVLHPPGVEPEPLAMLRYGRQESYRWTIDAACVWIAKRNTNVVMYTFTEEGGTV